VGAVDVECGVVPDGALGAGEVDGIIIEHGGVTSIGLSTKRMAPPLLLRWVCHPSGLTGSGPGQPWGSSFPQPFRNLREGSTPADGRDGASDSLSPRPERTT
jgi:hypothetical protein